MTCENCSHSSSVHTGREGVSGASACRLCTCVSWMYHVDKPTFKVNDPVTVNFNKTDIFTIKEIKDGYCLLYPSTTIGGWIKLSKCHRAFQVNDRITVNGEGTTIFTIVQISGKFCMPVNSLGQPKGWKDLKNCQLAPPFKIEGRAETSEEKREMIERLYEAWLKVPQLRFGAID